MGISRRGFLKALGVGGASAAVAAVPMAEAQQAELTVEAQPLDEQLLSVMRPTYYAWGSTHYDAPPPRIVVAKVPSRRSDRGGK